MRMCDPEQVVDRFGNWAPIAIHVQRSQCAKRRDDRDECCRHVVTGCSERMQAPEAGAVGEEFLIADAEQRPSERGEHRQFRIRPLDAGQRRSQGTNFLARVERTPAYQQVWNVPRLECGNVGPGHVALVETLEPPKEDADLARREWRARCRIVPFASQSSRCPGPSTARRRRRRLATTLRWRPW